MPCASSPQRDRIKASAPATWRRRSKSGRRPRHLQLRSPLSVTVSLERPRHSWLQRRFAHTPPRPRSKQFQPQAGCFQRQLHVQSFYTRRDASTSKHLASLAAGQTASAICNLVTSYVSLYPQSETYRRHSHASMLYNTTFSAQQSNIPTYSGKSVSRT